MTQQAGIRPFKEIIQEGSRKGLQFNMHFGQTMVMQSTKRFIAMLSGTQGGKTCTGPPWLQQEIARCGPGDYIAATATFPLLDKKMLPETLWLFRDQLKLGIYGESKRVFTFHDGQTRIIFCSAKNPEALESATAKAAWLDEAGQIQFRRDSWEAVQRRLSLNEGRILITTTLYCLGWLKTEIYDAWHNGSPDIDVIQFDSTANPSFPMREFERMQGRLPQWKFDMFYRGRFSKPAGLIYDCFDSNIHIVEPFDIPKTWPCYVGHDFGPRNTAAVWFTVEPGTGNIFAYREYLAGGMSTEEHCQKWKELSGDERIIKRVGGAMQEQGWRDACTSAGWPVLAPRITSVDVGIDSVYALHKRNQLFVFNNLPIYLDQKTTYSRKLDDNYEPTDKIEDKASFHLMDAERYILSDFDPKPLEPERKFARVMTCV